MKTIQIILISIIALFILSNCSSAATRNDLFFVKEEGNVYEYWVYSYSGTVIDHDITEKYSPKFEMLDNDVIKLTVSYGTNAYDCIYYDLRNESKSIAFSNALKEFDGYVIREDYLDGIDVIVVDGMFSELEKPIIYPLSNNEVLFDIERTEINNLNRTVILWYYDQYGTLRSLQIEIPK